MYFLFQKYYSHPKLEKLKVLKGNLEIWDIEVFGKVEERKKSALEKVAHVLGVPYSYPNVMKLTC